MKLQASITCVLWLCTAAYCGPTAAQCVSAPGFPLGEWNGLCEVQSGPATSCASYRIYETPTSGIWFPDTGGIGTFTQDAPLIPGTQVVLSFVTAGYNATNTVTVSDDGCCVEGFWSDSNGNIGVLTSCWLGGSPDFVRGDADGNASVDALTDGLFLLQFGFAGGTAPPCSESADANDDGSVTPLTDALYLFAWGFLGGPAPLPPYPDCGQDPTDDDLTCDMGSCP